MTQEHFVSTNYIINGLDDDTRKLIDILVCKYFEGRK